jgi:uncharacterized protein (DUF433 family)
LTLRVAEITVAEIDQRAHETGQTRNALAERYLSEGLRTDEHPLIYFRDGVLGRRPAVVGTRLDVWQVVETVRAHANSVDEAADYLGMAVERVRAAFRYYAAYRDEVDAFATRVAAAAERAEEAWRTEQGILAS